MSVGQASGLALVAAARAGCPGRAVQPERGEARGHRRRRAPTRRGADDGHAAARPARGPKPPDAADASLALCHLWPRRCTAGSPSDRRADATRHGRSGYDRAVAAALAKGNRDRLGPGHGHRAHAERRGARRGRRRRLPLSRARRARCRTSMPGTPTFLFTHLHVREDAMVLYGFPTRDERDTFEALIGATGVGPEARARDPVGAHAERVAALPRRRRPRRAVLVPGVGKRTAQRLLVELKARLEVPDLDLRRRRHAVAPRPGRGARRARRARLRRRRGARPCSASSATTARSRTCCATRSAPAWR